MSTEDGVSSHERVLSLMNRHDSSIYTSECNAEELQRGIYVTRNNMDKKTNNALRM